MYASKTTAGASTTPETTPGGVLVVTPEGLPYLLRVAAGGLIESHRTSSGWVDQVVDSAGIAGQHGTDKLGRVHIATLTEFANAPLPGISPERWAYDAARGRAILYSGTTVATCGRLPITMEWNTVTKTWATGGPMLYASFPGQVEIVAAGFDWNSGKVIGVGTDQSAPKTFRWDGAPTGWTAIADQNTGSSRNALLGYDGPSSTFMAIVDGALLRWTGTAWESINSVGATVPGTLVYDDERKLILGNPATTAWFERTSPGGNVPPTGLGKMGTAGPGKMAFWSESPIAVGTHPPWRRVAPTVLESGDPDVGVDPALTDDRSPLTAEGRSIPKARVRR